MSDDSKLDQIYACVKNTDRLVTALDTRVTSIETKLHNVDQLQGQMDYVLSQLRKMGLGPPGPSTERNGDVDMGVPSNMSSTPTPCVSRRSSVDDGTRPLKTQQVAFDGRPDSSRATSRQTSVSSRPESDPGAFNPQVTVEANGWPDRTPRHELDLSWLHSSRARCQTMRLLSPDIYFQDVFSFVLDLLGIPGHSCQSGEARSLRNSSTKMHMSMSRGLSQGTSPGKPFVEGLPKHTLLAKGLTKQRSKQTEGKVMSGLMDFWLANPVESGKMVEASAWKEEWDLAALNVQISSKATRVPGVQRGVEKVEVAATAAGVGEIVSDGLLSIGL
eukprot:6490606-Amphidinium_carterae.4